MSWPTWSEFVNKVEMRFSLISRDFCLFVCLIENFYCYIGIHCELLLTGLLTTFVTSDLIVERDHRDMPMLVIILVLSSLRREDVKRFCGKQNDMLHK